MPPFHWAASVLVRVGQKILGCRRVTQNFWTIFPKKCLIHDSYQSELGQCYVSVWSVSVGVRQYLRWWGSELRCTEMHMRQTYVDVGWYAMLLRRYYVREGQSNRLQRNTNADKSTLTQLKETLGQAGLLGVCVTSMGVAIRSDLRHLAMQFG